MPESLNVLSYFIGWLIAFQAGVFVGMWLQRRMIFNALSTGRQQVENLLGNVFKRGKNAQDHSDNQPADNWDSRAILGYGWQEKAVYGETVTGTVIGGVRSGADEGEDTPGNGEQGGEGFGGEAQGEKSSTGATYGAA